ncbi:hypothetical protein INT47_005173 [Mucor saturninus]|uniref:Uncharacterized protein n=1 Tax=Mucor saturninus TaxID=64648 RepID=A0A8H7QXQ1_9FUNG|nr:hypothetical protein INT47_005173 [Mucor saturninus]
MFNPFPTWNAANKRKINQTDILYDSVNRPIILASQVRHELHGSLSQIEISTLKKIAKNLKPTTMAEELDLMSTKLILDLNDGDINEVNALKLSLSKTVSLVNFSTLKVFQKYVKNESFWEEVNSVNIELAPAMSVTSEETFNRMIQLSKNTKGRLALKQLRLNIAKEKVKAIEENEDDITAVLDIMEIIARNVIADDTLKPNDNDSELTCYRKVAFILDILLKDSNLNLLDGETTCKASKSIAKDHENIYGNSIPLNRGFGRRIDLLLSTRNIELSTNEWKRKKVTQEQCLIQQAKNIRMNKAILSKLLELPLSENDSKNVYTLGMDWVGPRGYMFAVKKINNIYVAKHTNNISIPEYLHQLPSFLATLKNLYIWKNHHTKLQDTILTGVIAKEDDDFFLSIASGTDDAGSASKGLSPNIYLTPTKAKKNNYAYQNDA